MLSGCLNCILDWKAFPSLKHVNLLPNPLKFLHIRSLLSVPACCTHFAVFSALFATPHRHKELALVACPLAVDVMQLCQHIRWHFYLQDEDCPQSGINCICIACKHHHVADSRPDTCHLPPATQALCRTEPAIVRQFGALVTKGTSLYPLASCGACISSCHVVDCAQAQRRT